MSRSIQFQLNGKAAETACRPDTTVLEWLRGEGGLRGSKEGCAEGDCGACSVLVQLSGDANYSPANSCIMLMGQLEGGNLVTVEGLAQSDVGGHPVQKLMAENGSSQCGFCTPGIVCALAGLGERNINPSESDIHDALAGNLCRCTGYRPIVEAARAAVLEKKPDLPVNTDFPPSDVVGSDDCIFQLPKSLDELLQLKQSDPEAVLLAGGTDLSLDVAHARARWRKTIFTGHVAELKEIHESADGFLFGGAVTWGKALPLLLEHWPSFGTLVRRFGSTQIRAMGTMAGNLANASPIGDGAPALIALGAVINVKSLQGERNIPAREFFKGYREPDLTGAEIIASVSIPKLSEVDNFRVYKISKRYDQDISTVCAAFNLRIENGQVAAATMAFGGMAATPIRCPAGEDMLVGKGLNDPDVVSGVCSILKSAFAPMSDMRGSADYRAQLVANLFQRYVRDIAGETVEVMAL